MFERSRGDEDSEKQNDEISSDDSSIEETEDPAGSTNETTVQLTLNELPNNNEPSSSNSTVASENKEQPKEKPANRNYFHDGSMLSRLGNFILQTFYVASDAPDHNGSGDGSESASGVSSDEEEDKEEDPGTHEADGSRIYPAEANTSSMLNSTADQESTNDDSMSKAQTGALNEDVSDFEKVKSVGEFCSETP